MKLWDISIRQPVFMTMILTAGIVLGVVSYFRMPAALFPDVDFPIMVVTTVYPGVGPEEIESQVTEILEDELGTASGIDSITSRSAESVSTIILQFDLDTSGDSAAQDVRDRINLVRNQLPEDIQEPVVARFNPSDSPILVFGVADTSGRYTPTQLKQLVEDAIQSPLLRVPGVAAVDVEGGLTREIRVELDMAALESRRIAPQQVIGALQMENMTIPGGSIVENNQELLLRTPGKFETLKEIENVVVTRRGPATIYVRDVATVVDDFAKRDTITRLNGEGSILVSVKNQSDTNTTAVAEEVKRQLEPIQASYPELEIAIASDESELVRQSTTGALEDLLWGSLLAGLVILFFFRDLRNTLITIGGLPIIMIATVFFMDMLDISFNQISLLALALVVGLVIDDAIVVRENIMRWIERGYHPREAASLGTAEVVLPVLATSATILAVFLPVAYAEGIIGKFFRDFGLTVSLAILVSTFEALTFAPMLSAYFFRAKEVDGAGEGGIREENAQEEIASRGPLTRVYDWTLNLAMDHKWLTLLSAVGIIALTVLSASLIQTTFLPSLDRGQFQVTMELPPGTALEVTTREAIKVEEILRSHPDVGKGDLFVTIGGRSTPERASFSIAVAGDENTRPPSRQIIDQLRGPLASVPGIAFQVADNVAAGSFLVGSRDVVIEMVAFSGSYDELGKVGEAIAADLARVPGTSDIDLSYKPGRPELQLKVDRQKAAQLGLSTAQVGASVRSLINGQDVTTFQGEGAKASILVQLSEKDRSTAQDILNLRLLTPSGQLTPISTIASISYDVGPNVVQRVDRLPTISIGLNAVGRSTPDVTEDVQAYLAQLSLPANIEAKLGGDAEQQADAFGNLTLALLLSVVFIYMVLASQFASFIQPLLIMIAMPLAIIGAIMGLVLAGRPLDMTAFIGFIMLMGLVTKNSILLVDFANRERQRGASADLAMRRAGPIRLRPIMMTALSLILAMVPVALGLGAGGEFRSSMAIAIMGGMITSTFLTLIIVPVAYSMVVGFQDRLTGRLRDQKSQIAESLSGEGSVVALEQPIGD